MRVAKLHGIMSYMKIKIEQHTFSMGVWLTGWLFTLGFLGLSFGKGLLALFVWPYFIGQAVATMVAR